MKQDFIQKFTFTKLPIRGVFVDISKSWQTIASQQEYSDSSKRLIGEMLVGNILLTANLKLKGKLTTQIQNNPYINLAVSECDNNFNIRATLKAKDQTAAYTNYIRHGYLVISINSETEGKIYQSLVQLESNSLSENLNNYMINSEQLDSIFIIAYSHNKVTGLLLQQLPQFNQDDEIKRIFTLARTVTDNELLNDELTHLLHKLFNEDDIQLFDSQNIKFSCTCSSYKVANMIVSLGRRETEEIIQELGKIIITCDYCNLVYEFNQVDDIFANVAMEGSSHAIH